MNIPPLHAAYTPISAFDDRTSEVSRRTADWFHLPKIIEVRRDTSIRNTQPVLRHSDSRVKELTSQLIMYTGSCYFLALELLELGNELATDTHAIAAPCLKVSSSELARCLASFNMTDKFEITRLVMLESNTPIWFQSSDFLTRLPYTRY